MSKIISHAMVLKTICAIWPSTTMHAKRKGSIATIVWGILFASRLSSSTIGRALARRRGGTCSAKHSIKQVDRLLGNDGIDTVSGIVSFARWVVGYRREIIVSLDWTSYGRNRHSTIIVNLITSHGRATPLVWKSVEDTMLKRRRSTYEREVLALLKSLLAPGTGVTVLADRGFADTKFFRYIVEELGWRYIIRIKENTYGKTEHMSRRKIRELTALNGRILEYKEVLLTAKEYCVGALVTLKTSTMKEPWLLATNLQGQKERVVKLYGRRFTCEEHFRDTKDDRYGVGLKVNIR